MCNFYSGQKITSTKPEFWPWQSSLHSSQHTTLDSHHDDFVFLLRIFSLAQHTTLGCSWCSPCFLLGIFNSTKLECSPWHYLFYFFLTFNSTRLGFSPWHVCFYLGYLIAQNLDFHNVIFLFRIFNNTAIFNHTFSCFP